MSIFHKVFGSLFLSKPSVHLITPRAINLYFKNAKSSKYKLLNLSNYDCVEINIVKDKTQEDVLYKLNLNVFSGETSSIITVAVFESKEEVEKASLILRNKLYSPGKTLLKFAITIILSILIVLTLFTLIFGTGGSQSQQARLEQQQMLEQLKLQQKLQQLSPQAIPQSLPSLPMPSSQPQAGNLNPEEILRRAQMEAQRIMQEGEQQGTDAQRAFGAVPNPMVENVQSITSESSDVDLPQDPAVSKFLNALN